MIESTYHPRGLARVEKDRNRLRIRLPKTVLNGKDKTFSLGLSANSPRDWNKAQEICDLINTDIRLDLFDPTLERYLPQYKTSKYLEKVKNLFPDISLMELWQKYMEYKTPTWKPSTLHHRQRCITPLIKKSGVSSPYDALELRQKLINITSEGYVKKTLQQVNAAFKWGIKHKLVRGTNPYDGMASEFKENYEKEEPKPNAFSNEEKLAILEAFQNHKIRGNSYKRYYPLVKFWFLTGCRPSEGIGLKWENIKASSIEFTESITTVGGKPTYSDKSKNNKTRLFPMNQELRGFLDSIKPEQYNPTDLVFPSPDGKPINYGNFSQRAWDSVVDPISKRNTTPYSCRDTFITEQVNKGVPPALVAKWCDTSVGMIERHYYDNSVAHILPM
ncbi:tyrosine-type recombinase/integrase [Planktothrix sp.]|uniref:tyrosine-type recombinase/integrase n=1 Tax=Planktothrix sp. TaxID=3088171 RepID=UPI0038D3F0E7